MKKTKVELAAERIKKKVSQLVMLMEQNKGKKAAEWDWHSIEHIFRDGSATATATNDKIKRKLT